ncbi:MAG: glycosyltransferase [Rhodomicrobium sp.]
MTRCVFAIPGSLATPTGGYTYARKILPLLGAGMETQLCELPSGFPFPTDAELTETVRAIAAASCPGTVFMIDGLAFGAMPEALIARIGSPIAALVHHPLGLEEGLSAAEKTWLLSLEGQALALAQTVIVPSQGTAQELSQLFGEPAEKVTIAEPGILRGKRAIGSRVSEPLHIVSVGSLTPRKGFAVLIDALLDVSDLAWRATIAGSPDLSPHTAAEVRQKISSYGLADRVRGWAAPRSGSLGAPEFRRYFRARKLL